MATYTHIQRGNGDTILSEEWNNMGKKLESLNAKFNEEQSVINGSLSVKGVLNGLEDSKFAKSLSIGKNLHISDQLSVNGISTFNSIVQIPKGKLGVGTADPKNLLEVRQDIRAKLGGILGISNYGGGVGSSTSIDFRTYNTASYSPTSRIIAVDTGRYSNTLHFQTKKPGNAANPLETRMFISDGGNVGIGTTAPSTPLHIYTPNNYPLKLQTSDDSYLFTGFYDKSNRARGIIGLDANLKEFLLKTYNGTDNIHLASNTAITGSLGIGTKTPSAPLHIKSSSDGILNLQTTDNTWLYTQWLDKNGNRRLWMGLNGDLGEFWLSPENGTSKIILNSQTKINNRLMAGNTGTPEAPISIGGDGKESTPNGHLHITHDCILFGGRNSGKETHSAQISAGKHIANSLNIVGMSANTSSTTRRVDMWAEAGFHLQGNGNTFRMKQNSTRLFLYLLRSSHGTNRQISWDGDTNWDWASDAKLKTNVKKENSILNRLVQLDVVNYNWKDKPEGRKSIGLLAQDVQPLFPSLVGENPTTEENESHLTLKYASFGVLAVGAIKELKQEKDTEAQQLRKQIAQMEKQSQNQFEFLTKQIKNLQAKLKNVGEA